MRGERGEGEGWERGEGFFFVLFCFLAAGRLSGPQNCAKQSVGKQKKATITFCFSMSQQFSIFFFYNNAAFPY